MKNKNNQIEALRAAAIAFVLLSHFPVSSTWPAEANRYVELWAGVDLFFVISGYLITLSLLGLRDAQGRHEQWLELKSFWIRRAFRLLPAAWLWLLIPILMSILLGDQPLFAPLGTLLNDVAAAALQVANLYWATCIGNGQWGQVCSLPPIVGPYWSLSLEEQFYLLLPLVMILMPSRLLVPALVVLIGAHVFWSRPIFTLAFFTRPDALLWGVLLALLSQRASYFNLPERLKGFRGSSLVSIALLMLLAWSPTSGVQTVAGVSTVATVAMISAMLVWLASCGSGIEPGRLLRWMASRSYALYLVHFPLYALTQILLFPVADCSILQLAIYAICSGTVIALAAELTYRWVELPLRNYGRQLALSVSGGGSAQPA
ncbi:MAG: acyltransferase [Pseudomonas sp.]|nr:MAG: acyltransferase [Pseudomonas sp.]